MIPSPTSSLGRDCQTRSRMKPGGEPARMGEWGQVWLPTTQSLAVESAGPESPQLPWLTPHHQVPGRSYGGRCRGRGTVEVKAPWTTLGPAGRGWGEQEGKGRERALPRGTWIFQRPEPHSGREGQGVWIGVKVHTAEASSGMIPSPSNWVHNL